MIQKNNHYKLHRQMLAFYKVQQRKSENSMVPHHLHVPVGCRLETLIRSLLVVGTTCNSKNVAAKNWSEPLKWIWQVILVDSYWQTPRNYMHTWLVEFKAILHKDNFILSFQTSSSSTIPWNISRNVSHPCSPVKFYLEKLNVEIFC